MEATEKQILCRARNWLKFKIMGMHIGQYTYGNYLLQEEKDIINQIFNLRQQLVDNFDKNSKQLGLKVPEYRCWCGKEGKYPVTCEILKSQGVTYTCKKHRDEN